MVQGMRMQDFPGMLDETIPMENSRFTEARIMGVLRQAEGGLPGPERCRQHGISRAAFYRWRARYGGMDASMTDQRER